MVAVVVGLQCTRGSGGTTSGGSSTTGTSGGGGTGTTNGASSSGTGTTSASRTTTTLDPAAFYGPINTSFPGLVMFRGNGSRTFYGQGPVPKTPEVLWKFGPMVGESDAGPLSDPGAKSTWKGSGWTGQPAVFERDGKTWVVFGAYDHKIHFLDAQTGKRLLPDFTGGDLMKGSVVVDPDGFALVYMGCRDNNWRVIAIDRGEPTELWHMNAHDAKPLLWNDDWDGNAVIRDDYAFVPGENGHFFVVKLNRGKGADGKVTVKPQIVLDYPGWTDQLLKDIGDKEVSIENSPAVVGDRLYFANSGGLITGLDISATLPGAPSAPPATGAGTSAPGVANTDGQTFHGLDNFPRVFSYWDGDDTDASLVADDQGFLYAAVEMQRWLPRAEEVGQLIKLDPRKNAPGDDPLVWSVKVTKKAGDGDSGIWATPALYKDVLYVPTHPGSLLCVDRATGAVVWQKEFTPHAWGSAVVVDETLIVGDTDGYLRAYDVRDTRKEPSQLWAIKLGGDAVEATPAVWKGRIYVANRDGYFNALGDR